MERQLFVAQLAMLFQQASAQHGFRRQTPAAGRLQLQPALAQIRSNPGADLGVLVQKTGHGLQLTTKLVARENIEYIGLDGAFFTHCCLRR